MFGWWAWQDIIGKGPLWKDGSRHHKNHCPRCKRSLETRRAVSEGKVVREHCGCKMDEFGNELSFPANVNDLESW